MSRILRRPMFRGGSTNQGIMSVPRKGYANSDDGGVQGFDLSNYPYDYNEDNYIAAGKSNDETLTIDPRLIKSEVNQIKDNKKTYKALGQDIEEGSYGDVLLKEYLGNRPDPLGKFLIQFGLNYMSATPKGGKFGALATAAESAKKPTEQLYADVDTDRLLKLKLMSALGKSESKGSFEKKVNFIWQSEQNKPEGQRNFKSKEDVVDYLRKQESERKITSPEELKRERSKEIMSSVGGAPNKEVANNMAEFEITGINKLNPSERSKLDLRGNFYVPALSIKQKTNSTDFAFVKPDKAILSSLETGLNYVDPGSKSVYTYVGPNTFRFVSKY